MQNKFAVLPCLIQLLLDFKWSSVDKNDNSPVFSQPAQSLNVNEKTSVPVEYPLVGATDRDTQPNR